MIKEQLCSKCGSSYIEGNLNFIEQKILHELHDACLKHPKWPDDPLHASAIIHEELGELTQAILYHVYEKGPIENVKLEAYQMAAMALRFLLHLEGNMYYFEQSSQHSTVVEYV